MSDIDLFVRIARLIPTLHGWADVQKAQTLAAMVLALRPDVTVELGLWGGRSFLPMAMAHKEIGKGIAVGIDPWSPIESAKAQEHPKDVEYWGNADHEMVRLDFLKHVHELGVQNCVRVIQKTSDAADPPPKIDILHIDGNHSDQAVKDVQRYASKIRVGGLCVMDDIHWTGGGVQRAVEHLKEMGFAELYSLGTGAVFQRI